MMMSRIKNMRKKYLFTLLIFSFIVIIFLSLIFSDRFNNFVFSNIVNPYDPLVSNVSKSNNRQTKLSESDIFQTKIPQSLDSIVNDSQITNKVIDNNEYWNDPRGLFPIFAYNVPDSTKDLAASLKIIERGGINIIVNANMSWMPGSLKLKKAFQKLGNSNLKLLTILANECRDDFIFGNSNDETNSHIKKYLNEFNDNFIYGWYIWDEPGRNKKFCSTLNLTPNDDYADINTMVKQIRSDSTFSKKLDYVNLFPDYWDGTPTLADYEKYIDAFVTSQDFKPRVLCVDFYPWLKPKFGGFRKDYYSNLEVIRKKSIQYNIPSWMIVLSSKHMEYENISIEEISLQVYSALAYGAKGIGYYLYSKSWAKQGYTSWILENNIDNDNVPDSLHGPLYLPVKKLNEQIQALGKTLLNLECVEVIQTSDYPNNQKDISQTLFRTNQSNSLVKEILNNREQITDSTILIGVFDNKIDTTTKGKYLMIVNKDVYVNSNCVITLNDNYNIFKFDKDNGNKSFITKSNKIIIIISPGSGELYYIE